MKKLLLAILIPTGVLVAAAGTLFLLVFNNETPAYQMTSDTSETILSRNIYNAFKNTKTEKSFTYSMGQNDFNQILSLAYQSMNNQVKEFVRGAEIKIDGENYIINIYAKAWIVQSKVEITCKFSQDDKNYYLKIDHVKLGHIPGLQGIAMNILKSSIGEKNLQDAIQSTGVSLQVDLENSQFIYSKETAKKDLTKLLQEDNKPTLASAFISNAFDMNLLSLSFENKFQAKMDLEPLATNAKYCSEENKVSEDALNLETNKTRLKTLMDNGKVDDQNDHPQIVFNYLLRGYDSIETDEQAYIDTVDMSGIGFNEIQKKAYTGYQPEEVDIKSELLHSAMTNGLISENGFLLTESMVNKYIQYQDLMGYSFLFTHTEDKKTYDFAYVTIDNFYVNLGVFDEKEQMNVVLGLNINGYETSLILENTKSESLNYGMKLTNTAIYLGDKQINDELKTLIYEQIEEKLPENEFLTFDGEGTFIVNFEGYLSTYIDKLNSIPGNPLSLNLTTSIEGTSLADEKAGFRLKGKTVLAS